MRPIDLKSKETAAQTAWKKLCRDVAPDLLNHVIQCVLQIDRADAGSLAWHLREPEELWLLISDADVVAQTALHFVETDFGNKLPPLRQARLEPRPCQRVGELPIGCQEIGIWRERGPVDLGFGSRERLLVEGCKASCYAIHEAIQFSIGNRSCHPSIALCQISVIVIAAQDGFERSIPTDQSGQTFASATAWQNAEADLGLTENRMLAASLAQIARQSQLVTAAPSPAPDGCDADEWRFGQSHDEIDPGRHRSCIGCSG